MTKTNAKKKKQEQAPRKRRITPRQLMTGWIVVVLAGTGAWYALAAIPDAKEIQQLESNLRRAESRLTENRERVAELETEIAELEVLTADLDAEYAAYEAHVGELVKAAEYGEALAAQLADAGLEVTQAQAPDAWETTVGSYRKASFALDANGTYAAVMAALEALEATPGVSVRELQIIKSGGDPNDPLLVTRFALDVHVKAN